MRDLVIQWRYKAAIATGIGFAQGNVWSRAARRKKQHSLDDSGSPQPMQDKEAGHEPALGVRIQLRMSHEDRVTIAVRWLQGHDSVLFESFCGMLKRQFN